MSTLSLLMILLLAPILLGNPRNLLTGAVLGCIESATLGQPLEVWKTRSSQMRNETAIQSLQHIYKARGLSGFWIGLQPRLFEACTKGAILVYSREVLLSCCGRIGVRGAAAAALSGMGSGVAQTVVMGPATLLVVAANDAASTGREHGGLLGAVRAIHSERGIAGFAAGAGPMALRQASNWGSRQVIS